MSGLQPQAAKEAAAGKAITFGPIIHRIVIRSPRGEEDDFEASLLQDPIVMELFKTEAI